MLFKNPLLLEADVAAQCLWVLLGQRCLPVWHCQGCWASPGCLQMGPPQKQIWSGHTMGPHGEPHGRGRSMHSAGNGMELLRLSLWLPQSPRGWPGASSLLVPPVKWVQVAEHSVGLRGLTGAGQCCQSGSEEEGDERGLRSQARGHSRDFCLGLVSGPPAHVPLPHRVHSATAGGSPEHPLCHGGTTAFKGRVNLVSILACPEDSGPSPVPMAMGPAGLQPPPG